MHVTRNDVILDEVKQHVDQYSVKIIQWVVIACNLQWGQCQLPLFKWKTKINVIHSNYYYYYLIYKRQFTYGYRLRCPKINSQDSTTLL